MVKTWTYFFVFFFQGEFFFLHYFQLVSEVEFRCFLLEFCEFVFVFGNLLQSWFDAERNSNNVKKIHEKMSNWPQCYPLILTIFLVSHWLGCSIRWSKIPKLLFKNNHTIFGEFSGLNVLAVKNISYSKIIQYNKRMQCQIICYR